MGGSDAAALSIETTKKAVGVEYARSNFRKTK